MTYDSTNLIATIDIRQLDNVRLGLLRVMFPAFTEEIELGRYVRRLLHDGRYHAVHLQPHLDSAGHVTPHIVDVFASTADYGVQPNHTPVASSRQAQ